MIDYIIYIASMMIFFYINLRILQGLHIEKKFENMRIWEIKAAYFMISLAVAHILSEMVLKITDIINVI